MEEIRFDRSAQIAPPEILQHIFSLIARDNLPRLRLVCRVWSDAAFTPFFRVVHIHLHAYSCMFLAWLASTPAACGCIRQLTISLYEGVDACYVSTQLGLFSGMLNNASSLTIISLTSSAVVDNSRVLVDFVSLNCASARRLSIRGAFLPESLRLDTFLSSFAHLEYLDVHDMSIPDGVEGNDVVAETLPSWPWPFGLRPFNTENITNLSYRVRPACPRYHNILAADAALYFPSLRELDLHIDCQGSDLLGIGSEPAIANIFINALSNSHSLHLIRYFVPSECHTLPPAFILEPLLHAHLHRVFTLMWCLEGVEHRDNILVDLMYTDGKLAEAVPDARCHIIVAVDDSRYSDLCSAIMPKLYTKGKVEIVFQLPSVHDQASGYSD